MIEEEVIIILLLSHDTCIEKKRRNIITRRIVKKIRPKGRKRMDNCRETAIKIDRLTTIIISLQQEIIE